MFSFPMFRREYRAATRKRRPILFRILVSVALALITCLVGFIVFTANPQNNSRTNLILFGRSLFVTTVCVEFLILVFFVPAFVGGSVAEERERDTLPMLLLTRLTPFEIVTTKAFARWLPTINLILAGLPLLVLSAWLASLELETAAALFVLFSSSAFMATLSVISRQALSGPARAQATALGFLWLVMPPLISIIPITRRSLMGELLAELKFVCVLIAPSSPLSLVTDRSWLRLGLGERIALMVGLQTLFGMLAIAFAANGLQAREKNPNWLDATRGYRPPCGDDPIFWREYELPMRRGGSSLVVIRLRHVWIMIRVVLLSLLGLVLTLFQLAVPIGLTVSTLYFGFSAFQELWMNGTNGPFLERDAFNILMRAGTGILGLMPLLGMPALVAGRVTTERDKKTWDAFLTTPLDAKEILGSKARVAVHGMWQSARPLPVLWVLGLACGVITFPGVLLATVDLLLTFWATVALGLYLSLRPGETSVAASRSALSMLMFLVLHTPVIWFALASPRELAKFASLPALHRGEAMLAVLAVPTLTGLYAWFLTRRTLNRFDEWVGRPRKVKGTKAILAGGD